MTPPQVYWLTEIFHPNVYPIYDCEAARQRPALRGLVCLGVLAEAYQPSLDLGDLCQTLRDLAGFRNYGIVTQVDTQYTEGVIHYQGNAFDVTAAAWVLDHPERIKALGGRAWHEAAGRAGPPPFAGRLEPLTP